MTITPTQDVDALSGSEKINDFLEKVLVLQLFPMVCGFQENGPTWIKYVNTQLWYLIIVM